MNTEVVPVDPEIPDPEAVRRAADVLRSGGLVAFPTETVYGLGANALDPAAVARIFAAKGRPTTNPLIVHVADPNQVLNVAATWPETAAKLAWKFWPGPLTVVVPKAASMPDVVTAGGPTVAVRCPAHPVARALIREAGVPVAAPSANRSTELSPTQVEHVLKGLNGRIEMVLDGGPCPGGIESTVVDVTGGVVRLLRPGPVTVPMLEEVVGRVEVGATPDPVARSPGQMAKHYSPRTPLTLCESPEEAQRVAWERTFRYERVGWLTTHEQFERLPPRSAPVGFPPCPFLQRMPDDPAGYAAALYAVLHEMDALKLDGIVVALPPDRPEWAGVRDRLKRAAAEG